jgi:uncharacterized protein (TIRG00374 family)
MKISQKIRWFFVGTTPRAQRARQVAKIALLVTLFGGLFWVIPLDKVLHALATADPGYIGISLGLAFLMIFLTSTQMVPLLRQLDLKHNVGQIMEINLAVKFYVLFTPGTIVSTGIKWFRFSQPGGKVTEAFVVLAFYRILETFVSISIGLVFWFLSGSELSQTSLIWIVLLLAGIILFWIALTRFSRPLYRWFRPYLLEKKDRPFWDTLLKRLDKLLDTVSTFAEMRFLHIALALSLGFAAHLTGVFADLILARAVGIQISYLNMGWIYAIIYTASVLPIAVAGGTGLRELTLVTILSTFGVQPEIALAFSLLILARMVIVSVTGGALELLRTVRERRLAD